jgi:hypothetical protein
VAAFWPSRARNARNPALLLEGPCHDPRIGVDVGRHFFWLDDDELGSSSIERRAETVTRIARYALETDDARRVYRF